MLLKVPMCFFFFRDDWTWLDDGFGERMLVMDDGSWMMVDDEEDVFVIRCVSFLLGFCCCFLLIHSFCCVLVV